MINCCYHLLMSSFFSDSLVCEFYKCNSGTFPDGFNHSYQICHKSDTNTRVCQSVYNYTNGYLIPVFKGCSNVKSGVSTNEECLINNPSILSKRNGTISCYCTGNICNQNETFTHRPKLATCGKCYTIPHNYIKC